ncbi:3162_t:CDS:2 [Cetraspora pellucida]|uniref:3162_t:CDS:1 n=1 Tax=Cetraspora pellucida TaxID=1433469 RepID=A0ACA9KJK2_9GLOM|nr:3162_t:CDS:2 [Cetraspora pellucida]
MSGELFQDTLFLESINNINYINYILTALMRPENDSLFVS